MDYSDDFNVASLDPVNQPMIANYQQSKIFPIAIGKNPAQIWILREQVGH